jgi:hypothetical protein
MSVIHEAQKLVYEELINAVKSFNEDLNRNSLPLTQTRVPEGKAIVRAAQGYKWTASRIARLARAVEVLESCDPHYGER